MLYCYTLATPEFDREDGLGVLSCPYQDYEAFADNAARLADAGYGGVELYTADPLGFDQDRVLAILARHRLEAAAIRTDGLWDLEGLSLMAENPYRRRVAINRFNTIAGFAAQLGAVVELGNAAVACAEAVSREDAMQRAEEACRAVGEYAQSLGVKLAIVPAAEGFPADMSTAEKLLERIALPNVGYMLAPGTGRNAQRLIADCGKNCLHVRLTDTAETALKTAAEAFSAAGYEGAFTIGEHSGENDAECVITRVSEIFGSYYHR